jgi:hypothetical protein
VPDILIAFSSPAQIVILICKLRSYLWFSRAPVMHNCVGFVGRYTLLVAVHVCIGVSGGGGVCCRELF